MDTNLRYIFVRPKFAGVTSGGAVPNLFQGLVTGGSNQVVFKGIPILAPVSAGVARVFRIINIRGDATLLGNGGSILAGVTISNGVLLQSPTVTASNVFTGLNASVRNAANSGPGAGLSPIGCGPIALTPRRRAFSRRRS